MNRGHHLMRVFDMHPLLRGLVLPFRVPACVALRSQGASSDCFADGKGELASELVISVYFHAVCSWHPIRVTKLPGRVSILTPRVHLAWNLAGLYTTCTCVLGGVQFLWSVVWPFGRPMPLACLRMFLASSSSWTWRFNDSQMTMELREGGTMLFVCTGEASFWCKMY